MRDWVWLDRSAVIRLQMALLQAHGGTPGLRDADALDTALGAAHELATLGGEFGPEPDAAGLAACYGHGLCTAKPFRDANRRTALLCTELFLRLNGWRLAANEADWLLTLLDLSIGSMDVDTFAEWLRERLEPEHH